MGAQILPRYKASAPGSQGIVLYIFQDPPSLESVLNKDEAGTTLVEKRGWVPGGWNFRAIDEKQGEAVTRRDVWERTFQQILPYIDEFGTRADFQWVDERTGQLVDIYDIEG